jgi:hypothetical protein
MPDPINPVRYPTLYRYHVNLPEGLNSYPAAQCTAEVADAPRKKFGDALKRDDLPADVKKMLETPWPRGSWQPEVHFMTVMALVRDIIYKNDEKYLQYIFEGMLEHFNNPLKRSLVYVMSPSVLAMVIEQRWRAYKRGIGLKCIKSTPTGRTLQLTYPAKIYLPSMLDGIARSLEAGLSCTKIKSVGSTIHIISDQECEISFSWEI